MVKDLKIKVRDRVIVEYGRLFSAEDISPDELREAIVQTLNSIIYSDRINLGSAEREKIIRDILDDFIGFGPIEPDEKITVTEIMINGLKGLCRA